MDTRESAFVLGQRYTFASLALGLALLSFLNLAGLEKAVFAIVLALRALTPAPHLSVDAPSGTRPSDGASTRRWGVGLGRVRASAH